MVIWNSLSCGINSSAMALKFPNIANVMVNTGGNKVTAWKTQYQLQKKGLKIIVLSSAQQGYPTYYDYIRANKLMPFYVSCCHKAKYWHLDRFYKHVGPSIVNIGYCKGEEKRAERQARKNNRWIKFQFPMLDYTREQCEKILRYHGVQASKTGCWFCPKQPNPPEWAIKNIIRDERVQEW